MLIPFSVRIQVSLIVTLILISPFTAFSQSNFQSGYYISLDNDTIQGLLHNRGEIGNFRSCIFKKDEHSKSLKFSAKEIQAYRFLNDKYYVSKTIKTSKGKETVFVEFLVNGISNLYFFRDPENFLYLIEDEEGNLIELYNEEEIVYVEGKGEVSKNTYRHIRMLKMAFSDCMEIQPQVDNARLTHKSLINLTKNYHSFVCDDQECIVYEKMLPPFKIQFAPVIGYTASNLQFDNDFYSNFTYDPNSNFMLGLQMNAILSRINEKIAIQLDLLYHKNNYYGTYNDYYELYIDNNMLETSLMLKYMFPTGKVKPSLGIGFGYNFILDSDYTAVVENTPGNPQERNLNDIYMATTLVAGVVQLGCNYRVFKNREIFSNFRYTYTTGQTSGSQTYVRATINMFNISLGFYLSKME